MNPFRTMCRSVSKKTGFLAIVLTIALFITSNVYNFNENVIRQMRCVDNESSVIHNYFSVRMTWKTSNLGSILFKNANPDIFIHPSRENKTFTILIWKYWERLSARHIYKFNKSRSNDVDILEDCSFQNCIFTGNNTKISTADAVVVHIQRGEYPVVEDRNPNQRWIILSDEAPVHTYSNKSNQPKLSELADLFNWTMTYRSDADIPVPSGRTVPLTTPVEISEDHYLALMKLVPNFNKKKTDVTTAILASNCYKARMYQLNQVQRYLAVDVYGKCGTVYKNACPGHFKQDCPNMDEYYFYLVMENASCMQYLTEKVFYHAYEKGAIPIIIGPSLEDCQKLLPPDSFIHIDNFDSMKELAETVEAISDSYEKLLFYHAWRQYFAVSNEHGYFGTKSYHYCRICEALNYNDGENFIYDLSELQLFFNPRLLCIQK